MSKPKVGLIGVGNMGTAIIEGLLKKGEIKPDDIFIYDKFKDKAAAFAVKTRVKLESSVQKVIEKSNLIILAIKPQDLGELSKELKVPNLDAGVEGFKCIISILAGIPISKIKENIKGESFRVVRAMPNLGAVVGSSVTALAAESANAIALSKFVFSGCGETVALEEKYFDLVTAISGSGPAYFFLLMELLVKEGVKNGLKESDAQLLAVQTALGAAKLAAEALGKETPAELRARVTSKGGTTAAALEVFEKHKIADIVSEAVTAAVNRGKELAKG